MSNFEEIKIYSLLDNCIRLIRCVKEVSSGRFKRVSMDFIHDPYDSLTLQSQEAYFLMGLVGAVETSEYYDSIEDLIDSYDEQV